MLCKTAIRARPAPARRAVCARADPTAPGPTPAEGAARMAPCNPDIRKDEDKVVDTLKVSDMKKGAKLCRCWRSATFPMCNNAHNKHNEDTGDNVGPVNIEYDV